jgi:hypothetical protein
MNDVPLFALIVAPLLLLELGRTHIHWLRAYRGSLRVIAWLLTLIVINVVVVPGLGLTHYFRVHF